MSQIQALTARMILDSRGNPTVETDLWLTDGSFGRAAVPSGASTGTREALELHDGGFAFFGKGVEKAINNIQTVIKPRILNQEFNQSDFDSMLLDLDGTDNFSVLGANAVLSLSMAFAVASAAEARMPLYRWIGQLAGNSNFVMPRPLWNLMNGGAHANWTTDIQEYMIQSTQQDEPFVDQVRKATEVFHALGTVLDKKGLSVQVGNEGGYAPDLTSNSQALELILEAISAAGYTAGPQGDFQLALDIAASELYQEGEYHLKRDARAFSSQEMLKWLDTLLNTYPICSIEDGLAEGDWDAWQSFTRAHGQSLQIVGDDLLVTNPKIVREAVEKQACNALLAKLNQIGTVSLTLQAMQIAKDAGWKVIPSHRSGETEDTFLAHLAVGTGAGQIKSGAPSRTDRTAKYNELLRITETL